MILIIRHLSAYYLRPEKLALESVSLSAGQHEIVALLGPNGAGKSTVLRAIFKEAQIEKGEILFEGANISNQPSNKLVHLGIAFVPEGRRLFGSMTVVENLDMGGFTLTDRNKLTANKEKVFQLFPFLATHRNQVAKKLSGGEQQMLAFGRALMASPKLILMDEPSLGLAPQMVNKIFDVVNVMNSLGVAILLVEQNVRKALEMAHRAYVLNLGRVAFEGTPKEIFESDTLKRTYLGR
jgi:branched-chain amino acid transport system ATP-binding protein